MMFKMVKQFVKFGRMHKEESHNGNDGCYRYGKQEMRNLNVGVKTCGKLSVILVTSNIILVRNGQTKQHKNKEEPKNVSKQIPLIFEGNREAIK